MAYFQTKNPNLGNIGRALYRMKNVGIFYGHVEYFTANGCFLWPFGKVVVIWYLFPVLVHCVMKNLATRLFTSHSNFSNWTDILLNPVRKPDFHFLNWLHSIMFNYIPTLYCVVHLGTSGLACSCTKLYNAFFIIDDYKLILKRCSFCSKSFGLMYALAAWYSGYRVRLKNGGSLVRIPARLKVSGI
jgi:hypothetical protein